MKIPKLLLGLLVGGLFGLLFWYWQKSTSAEDGALDLLDRLAAAEARARVLEAQLQQLEAEMTTPRSAATVAQDDLQRINGIGPVFEKRLREAGVASFAALAAQSPERLREIVGLQSWHAADPEAWIAEAQAQFSS